MKYYIIAGERSGDLHGGNLIQELKKLDENAVVRCWGGDRMKDEGGELVVHYRNTAFMGFFEVLMNIRKILGFIKLCKRDILAWKPDVVIFIDYPGFNLKIAKFVKKLGIKTCYFISPKLWAWNQKRVHSIKRDIDRMYCILPFEKQFYKKFNYSVDYVGNPLLDNVNQYQFNNNLISEMIKGEQLKIAILPGSRFQEVKSMLSTIGEIFDQFPNVKFYVAGVDNLPEELYESCRDKNNVQLITGKTYEILKISDGAIVTSGTATLETALLLDRLHYIFDAKRLFYKCNEK